MNSHLNNNSPADQPMESAERKAELSSRSAFSVRKILTMVVLGVVLYFAFAVFSDARKIRESLRLYSWSTFAIACGLAFGNYLLRFLKWEFYLAKLEVRGVPKGESFLTFLSGFVLTITPGKVGEVFKSWVLSRTRGVPMPKTAPIVVAERITDVIGIAVLISLGSASFAGGWIWAAIGLGLVATLLVFLGSRSLSLSMVSMLEARGGFFARIAPKLRDAYESMALLVKPSNLFVPTLLSIFAWALECLALWVILRGFGESVPVQLATFFYATSTLVGAIIPVPGGLGVTEGTLREQLLTLGHVSAPVATAAMILVRFSTLWFAVLVGLVAFALIRRLHPSLLDESDRS